MSVSIFRVVIENAYELEENCMKETILNAEIIVNLIMFCVNCFGLIKIVQKQKKLDCIGTKYHE